MQWRVTFVKKYNSMGLALDTGLLGPAYVLVGLLAPPGLDTGLLGPSGVDPSWARATRLADVRTLKVRRNP